MSCIIHVIRIGITKGDFDSGFALPSSAHIRYKRYEGIRVRWFFRAVADFEKDNMRCPIKWKFTVMTMVACCINYLWFFPKNNLLSSLYESLDKRYFFYAIISIAINLKVIQRCKSGKKKIYNRRLEFIYYETNVLIFCVVKYVLYV